MQGAWRNELLKVLAILIAGGLIGGMYNYIGRGVLVAALLVLGWHLWKLFRFEQAVLNNQFDAFQLGEGIWQGIVSRITYQRQKARRRKREYAQLIKEIRKSTNAMPDAAIILDQNYEIVVCNKASAELLGLRVKKDRGQRIDNFLRHPSFTRYLESDKLKKGVEIPSPINEGDWIFCRLVPYGTGQWLLLVRDISERQKMTTMRKDFVANASHELRSPLTVISGYLDSMAEDADIPDTWNGPVSQMRAQALRMDRIVEELLELSKLESPDTEQRPIPLDVEAILLSARKGYLDRQGTAEITVDASSDKRLLGIGAEIESVVSNLLSNAVRHTDEGDQIRLIWQASDTGADLVVSDTGEGIAEEHINRLTERFYRVDSGRCRDSGGIGLGLAIVKHALHRHDASLEIQSTHGEGATFICSFPENRLSDAA